MKKEESTYELITKKLKKLEEATLELEEFQKISKKEFLKDKITQHACFYDFVIAIEVICDIGNHILAKYYLKGEAKYKDIIIKLGEIGIIPEKFANQTKNMTDFRNLLIHVYEKIDPEEAFQNLQKAPEEFNKFARYYLKFLEKIK